MLARSSAGEGGKVADLPVEGEAVEEEYGEREFDQVGADIGAERGREREGGEGEVRWRR